MRRDASDPPHPHKTNPDSPLALFQCHALIQEAGALHIVSAKSLSGPGEQPPRSSNAMRNATPIHYQPSITVQEFPTSVASLLDEWRTLSAVKHRRIPGKERPDCKTNLKTITSPPGPNHAPRSAIKPLRPTTRLTRQRHDASNIWVILEASGTWNLAAI